VTARDGERLRVEQRVSRAGPIDSAVHDVREIELEPIAQVRSQSVGGSPAVRSLTRFTAVAGGTEIRHHIELDVDTWMPTC